MVSIFIPTFAPAKAQMAESVDALVSNTSGETHPGSSPGLGTGTKAGVPSAIKQPAALLYILNKVQGNFALKP